MQWIIIAILVVALVVLLLFRQKGKSQPKK
jgi:hypothetical protein